MQFDFISCFAVMAALNLPLEVEVVLEVAEVVVVVRMVEVEVVLEVLVVEVVVLVGMVVVEMMTVFAEMASAHQA